MTLAVDNKKFKKFRPNFSVHLNRASRAFSLPQLRDLRILIVDDHRDSLYLCSLMLESPNVQIKTTTSAKEAVKLLPKFWPDLLITELYLPAADGYWLMHQVKVFEQQRQVKIPTIALTTQVSPEARSRAYADGFCRYITKPFDMNELLAAIAQLSNVKLWKHTQYL